MCGIAGYIDRKKRPVSPEIIEAMCRIQAHRGPDDQGVYVRGSLALGHRRLSILDLSKAGHQPMVTIDDKYAIVFNGEIYNYVELRRDLVARGHIFRSGTDTEVILHAYREWGKECVTRFNGMWAFCIYDRWERELFLSRDRFGIKPLYYVLSEGCFVFASEIKGILAACPGERRVNHPYVARFLPHGLMDDGSETFFKGVRALPAAHSATYELESGAYKEWAYWSVESGETEWDSDADPIESLYELLKSAVKLHMRSDVPVGTCLSGGLDSSTLVCLMSEFHGEPIRTFSGLYVEGGYDESGYVNAVNQHTNTQAFPVWPEPDSDLLEDLKSITWHQDSPTAGCGLYTQFHVMKRAADEVKVVLDGQGGDELFAGYLEYFKPHVADLLRNRSLRAKVEAMQILVAVWWHWQRMRPFYWLKKRLTRRHGVEQSVVHRDLAAEVGSYGRHDCQKGKGRSRLEESLRKHLLSTRLPSLLHYEDRNSMAFSIEARVPLLDHRIVEYAMSLGSRWKIRGSWTKWVLRKAAERILPREVTWRRSKMGYPTPMAGWLRRPSERRAVEDVLFSQSLREREVVCPKVLGRVWQDHLSGHDHSWLVYRILTLELWYRHYIDDFVPCVAREVKELGRTEKERHAA